MEAGADAVHNCKEALSSMRMAFGVISLLHDTRLYAGYACICRAFSIGQLKCSC